ncbi:DUF6624 domain-containing protein [Spongiimicrobium salis]|uniref:DUF6624 domain-containing protein n=1 Tax=Spongiimicrobium salis TaxID=1667022 RepID=UPI00374D21AE
MPKISKEIISLRKNDQKYRMKWLKLNAKGEQETEKFKKITEKLINIDRSNTARMEEIVEKHGWPTFEKVGEEASNVAWLIVQHADRNPFFQEKCLELMEQALKEHQINPSNYAYLYDRVQLAKGEKQLYATQSTTNHNINAKIAGFQPIEDESNVQKRREEMNIEQHIEHYALSLNFDYRVPSEQEAVEKAKKFEDAYKIHIQRAKEAMDQGNYEAAALHYLNALNSDGYTKAEDYVEAARAMSLAKHDEIGLASFYLIKAAFKGYPEIAQVDQDPDFNYLKTESPDFWEHDLMKVIHTAQKQ